MPTWRFHLAVGVLITTFLVYFSYYLGILPWPINMNSSSILFWFHLIFIPLLGAVIPDFDERKTKIHRKLGLVLGGFIIISIIILKWNNTTMNDLTTFLFIIILFLLIIFIIGFAIPMRHHGSFHSVFAALVFTIIWIILELFLFSLSPSQALLIGSFGFVGYLSHLVLDRDLKWT